MEKELKVKLSPRYESLTAKLIGELKQQNKSICSWNDFTTLIKNIQNMIYFFLDFQLKAIIVI